MRKSKLKISLVRKWIRSVMQEFMMDVDVPSNSQSLCGGLGEVWSFCSWTNFGLMKQWEDTKLIRVQIYGEPGKLGEDKFMYKELAGTETADAPRWTSLVTQAASEQLSGCVELKGLLMSFLLPSLILLVWKYSPCAPYPSGSGQSITTCLVPLQTRHKLLSKHHWCSSRVSFPSLLILSLRLLDFFGWFEEPDALLEFSFKFFFAPD